MWVVLCNVYSFPNEMLPIPLMTSLNMTPSSQSSLALSIKTHLETSWDCLHLCRHLVGGSQPCQSSIGMGRDNNCHTFAATIVAMDIFGGWTLH